MYQTNHSNLYLSIGSGVGAILNFFIAFVTDYHVMGVMGFICVVVSIWAGVLTIREKRLSMRIMRENEVHYKKQKSGGHR